MRTMHQASLYLACVALPSSGRKIGEQGIARCPTIDKAFGTAPQSGCMTGLCGLSGTRTGQD
jgi:hypothetical protein